ncbi:nucleotidyltransferase-like protein [Paenibacillus sp. JSM ZJ436]|uniref:nucleotidyltransferase-like protein n=1 Tax=Paenibacillus sp. JSM ZJ436 TaxID=3376190 RepID=UPI0037C97AFA
MEGIVELANFSLYYRYSVNENALGAVAYRNRDSAFCGSLVHDFELNLLVVYEVEWDEPAVQHIQGLDKSFQLISVSLQELQEGLMNGEDSMIIRCLLNGDLIKDTDGRISQLRRDFLRFSGSLKEQKQFIGFARFLRHYVDTKTHLRHKNMLDAYQSITESLRYWACIELIDRDIHPEFAIWEQVSGLNTPVRKLYEELTLSSETLLQRIELVLLACEFSVLSRMADYSAPLVRILRSRKLPWTIQELMLHPAMEPVLDDLPLMIRKLSYRSIIHEEAGWKESLRPGWDHIRYYAI